MAVTVTVTVIGRVWLKMEIYQRILECDSKQKVGVKKRL